MSNGTKVVFEALHLHEDEDVDRVFDLINAAEEGEEIQLQHPPKYVIVSIPNADPKDFEDCTMEPGRVLIPVPVTRQPKELKIDLIGQTSEVTLKYLRHGVQLGFSMTVHRIQGKTLEHLILQLNKRSFLPRISFSSLYVSLSRGRKSDDIRLMPIHPNGPNLEYLKKLTPNSDLISWLKCFDGDHGSGAALNLDKVKEMLQQSSAPTEPEHPKSSEYLNLN